MPFLRPPAEGVLTLPTLIVAAVLFAGLVWLLHRHQEVLLRGIPRVSAEAVALLRIVLGAVLVYWVVGYTTRDLPWGGVPIPQQRDYGWWGEWSIVHEMAASTTAVQALRIVALVALVLFIVGLATRVAYAVAVVAIVGLVVCLLTVNGRHDLGMPVVALLTMLIAPWGDGFSVDEALRRRRGRERSRRDPRRYGLALWLPGLVLGLALAAAAYAKLGGVRGVYDLTWVTEGTVGYYFVEDGLNAATDWGFWIAAHHWAAVAMSAGAIVVESFTVLHVFFRNQLVRLGFGLAAAGLLFGFYAFQGLFWLPWWTIALVFLPWEWLAVRLGVAGAAERLYARVGAGSRERIAASGDDPDPALGRLPLRLAIFVATLVTIQAVAAWTRLEREPFISNYPMYSAVYTTRDAFDKHVARKFSRYTILERTGDGFVDATSRVQAIGDGEDAVLDLAQPDFDSGLQPGRPDDDLRLRLDKVNERYRARYGRDLGEIRVIVRERAFDWDRGQYVWKEPRALGTFRVTARA